MRPFSRDLPEPLISSRRATTAPFTGCLCAGSRLPVTAALLPGASTEQAVMELREQDHGRGDQTPNLLQIIESRGESLSCPHPRLLCRPSFKPLFTGQAARAKVCPKP